MFRDQLEGKILGEIEQVAVNGGGASRVPNTTNISFDCIEGEAMVIAMDLKSLAGSSRAPPVRRERSNLRTF